MLAARAEHISQDAKKLFDCDRLTALIFLFSADVAQCADLPVFQTNEPVTFVRTTDRNLTLEHNAEPQTLFCLIPS